MVKETLLLIFLVTGMCVSAQQTFHCGDTLTDSRDGKKYPTVQIGMQCWTAKNMDIGTQVQHTSQTDNKVIEKTCYQNKKENCDTLGGLYTWPEAVQYTHDTSVKIQGVCPLGWHIASVTEWKELYTTAGNGINLKSTKTNIPKWDGTNKTGFSAIPAGLAYYDVFGRKGDWAIFWTATSVNPDYSWSVEMDNQYQTITGPTDLKMTNTYLKLNAFSVRCVKD